MNQKISKSTAEFENISKIAFTIDSIVNWGPDKSQIILKNKLEGKNIEPGSKIEFNFIFTGKNRGATDAVFKIYLKGMPQPVLYYLSGNVNAPYAIDVKVAVKNAINAETGVIDINCYDKETGKFISSHRTDQTGNLQIKLPNELQYKITAKANNSDTEILDLRNVFTDTVIIVQLNILSYYNNLKFKLENPTFSSGSSALNPDLKIELNKLAFLMNQFPEINIKIDGHTDDEGDLELNKEMSEKRAENVKQYLQAKGVSPDKISTKSLGFSKPVSSNKNEQGKAQNRRVEITFSLP